MSVTEPDKNSDNNLHTDHNGHTDYNGHNLHTDHNPYNRPHLYVLQSLAGDEEEVIRLLYYTEVFKRSEEELEGRPLTTIPASMEYPFIPKAEFHRRRKGKEDTLITKNLFPGYVFFTTDRPLDFLIRMQERRFMATYGKHFKMLKRPMGEGYVFSSTDSVITDSASSPRSYVGLNTWSDSKDSKGSEGSEGSEGSTRSSGSYGPYGEPIGLRARLTPVNRELANTLMGRISDDEEKSVLGYCGLKRDSETGAIVRKNNIISEADEEKLKAAGIDVNVFLRMATSSSASSGSASAFSGAAVALQKDDNIFNEHYLYDDYDEVPETKAGTGREVSLFSAKMSHAVKIVKAGTPPTQRNSTNSRLVVLSGPLVGSEKNIIRADAHKRTATVRTEFMNVDTFITLPLEIMETIEIGAGAEAVFQ